MSDLWRKVNMLPGNPIVPGVVTSVMKHNNLEIVFDHDRGYHRLDPLPDAAEVATYYESDQFYNEHSPDDWFDKEEDEFRANLWDSYYQHLYDLVKDIDCTLSPLILDFGCGAGWWLRYIHESTSNPHLHRGVEPSQKAREAAGHPVWLFDTTKDIADGKLFDVVSLQMILEHVPNPLEFIKSIANKYLTPGGKILVTVPNEFNPLQRRLGYYGFVHRVHINYFNRLTLRALLDQAGFRVTYEGATFPMEIFAWAGIEYFGNDELGRKCHSWRLRLERRVGPRIFKLYRFLYRQMGIGRELIFVAERR